MKPIKSLICGVWVTVTVTWYLAIPQCVAAPYEPPLKSQIVFGDGYSDIGNTFLLTGSNWPQRPYFRGRFSNDQVWSELVSPPLNLPLFTYAYGGSRALESTRAYSASEQSTIVIPSITQQIDDFVSMPTDKVMRSLAVLFYTGAEFLENTGSDPTEVIRTIRESVHKLLQHGVQNTVLTTLPPLDQFPGVPLDRVKQRRLQRIVDTYNRGVISLVSYFSRRRNVVLWDVHGTFSEAMKNGTFETVDEPCLLHRPERPIQPCDNVEKYMFWDAVHVTFDMHRLLAKSFVATVTSSWPDLRVWGDV